MKVAKKHKIFTSSKEYEEQQHESGFYAALCSDGAQDSGWWGPRTECTERVSIEEGIHTIPTNPPVIDSS